MPSVSPSQARLMAAVAHDPGFAHRVGIPQSVGKEFNESDTGTGILNHPHRAFGGSMSHGDPLGGLAKPHAISLGKITPIAAPKQTPMNIPHPWFERQEARGMGKGFADGGGVYNDMPFDSGIIPGSGAGRTDRLPLSVGSGAHVIPSDVTSALGQGTSAHGGRILQAVLGGGTGPYETHLPTEIHGHGPPHAPAISPHLLGESKGGKAHDGGARVSILAASGEFVASPEQVRAVGERAIAAGKGKKGESAEDAGHRLLDEMIKLVRKFQIAWLRRAPAPKK